MKSRLRSSLLMMLAIVTAAHPVLAAAQSPEFRVYLRTLQVQATTAAEFSTTAVQFDATPVGATSASQTVVLTNVGREPLSFASPASATGPFLVQSNCAGVLASGASCVFNLSFAPTSRDAAQGTLSVPTSAGTKLVALAGQGTQAHASGLPASVDFGALPVGETSGVSPLVLRNTGNAALEVQAISVTGPFSRTEDCPASLAPGAECTVSLRFAPLARGAASGTLSVATSAGALSSTLQGTGLLAGLELSSTTLSFSSLAVGATSAAQSVLLSNTGNTTLTVSQVRSSGDYLASSGCPQSLAPGGSCAAEVRFTPTGSGSRLGSLVFVTSEGELGVSLSGVGLLQSAALSSSSLAFGSVTVGASSSSQAVLLFNSGNMPLSVGSITASGPFVAAHGCPGVLNEGASCSVSVFFQPSVAGAASGTLSVSTGAGTQSVTLTGTAAHPTAALAGYAAGSVQVGSSASGTATLTNNSPVSLQVSVPSSASVTGTGFAFVSSTCGGALGPGASCSVSLAFSPLATGAVSGALSIDAGAAGTVTAALSGTGLAASVSKASADNASFDVPHASGSGQNVAITNTGVGPVTVTGLTSSTLSGQFSAWMASSGSGNPNGGYCWPGVVLQPGWSCGAWMQDVGAPIGSVSSGIATFQTTAGNVSYTASFTVKGLAYSSASGATAAVTSGQTGTLYTLTLTNNARTPFYFPMFATQGGAQRIGRFTGTDAARFVITGTSCTGALAAGASCTVSVAATGVSTPGVYSAQFQPNGTYQQGNATSDWGWTPGTWLVNMGHAVTDVWVAPTTDVNMTAQASVSGSPMQYSDGTVAASCQAYRTGSTLYAPATTNGLYVVSMGAGNETVYCDMTTEGGGWTLVARSGGTTPAYAGCSITSANTPFGWTTATGSVSNLSAPYSMNVFSRSLPFSEVLMAYGPGNSNAWSAPGWRQPVPANFRTAYATTDAASPAAAFGMSTWMGHTTDTTQFYFRDVPDGTRGPASSYGLHADGWFTCYGDGWTTDPNQGGVPASYGGFFNYRHGLLYVR